ncbi:hypothetical protein NOCA280031 [metagenome]|uniref:Uncharacterized protein n=1 Tax=metagenome TaxID=256318 RepID=A0A2P2CEZ4_9ZZZZ
MQTPADPDGSPRDAPAFPAEAVEWLIDGPRRKVTSLAPAYLTAAMARAGHHLMAMPPDDTPVLDAVVASNQLPGDLDRLATRLRSRGRFGLVCSRRDQRIPWARKLDRVLGLDQMAEPADIAAPLLAAARFAEVEETTYRYWQVVNHESLELILRAELSTLEPADRESRITAALELYADYGRGVDGMQMPWVSTCYRAVVVDGIWTDGVSTGGSTTASGSTAGDSTPAEADLFDSSSDATLLIDFR